MFSFAELNMFQWVLVMCSILNIGLQLPYPSTWTLPSCLFSGVIKFMILNPSMILAILSHLMGLLQLDGAWCATQRSLRLLRGQWSSHQSSISIWHELEILWFQSEPLCNWEIEKLNLQIVQEALWTRHLRHDINCPRRLHISQIVQ